MDEQNRNRGMDTWNRLTAVKGEGAWVTGWKKVKGLSKTYPCVYLYVCVYIHIPVVMTRGNYFIFRKNKNKNREILQDGILGNHASLPHTTVTETPHGSITLGSFCPPPIRTVDLNARVW